VRFLAGIICGMGLLILAAFIADSWTTEAAPTVAGQTATSQSDRIVNWDVAEYRLHESFEGIRESVHELTR
jgi:hypothetical protein